MNDTDRVIGRLEEFCKWEGKEHEKLDQRLVSINQKIDDLYSFKWKVVGMASLVSFLTTSIVAIGLNIYRVIRG